MPGWTPYCVYLLPDLELFDKRPPDGHFDTSCALSAANSSAVNIT